MPALRAIVDRTYEVFNARDFDAYRDLLDEDVELVMSGIAVRGLTAVTDFVAATVRARPGLRIEPQRVFVESGDLLVTEVRMIDTTTVDSGEDAGLIETSACGLYRAAGGRIAEWRVYLDPQAENLSSAVLPLRGRRTDRRRRANLGRNGGGVPENLAGRQRGPGRAVRRADIYGDLERRVASEG